MSLSRTAGSIMRAIRVATFGGIENLKLETNVPVPKPGENQVLIKVLVAGVNPVDTYIRAGAYPLLPALPYTPGMDAAGIIEDVGPSVTGFKKGDRVFTARTSSGAYAEYTVAEAAFVNPLMDSLSFEQGASIGVAYFTAIKALHIRGQAKPGETVLIHGASGAVGLAAVQVSRAHGLRIVGTAGTREGMDLVKATGADFVFNHREEGYVKAIQEAVGGADIILEMLSNVNLQKDLDLVNPRGRVMIVGCRGPIEINPRSTMGKESSIMGVSLMTTAESEWSIMKSMVSAGQTVGWLKPHVGRKFSLDEAGSAQHEVINTQGAQGKIVIDMNQ